MAKSATFSDDYYQYCARYRSRIKSQEQTVSLGSRLHDFLFTLADPSCPMHEHILRNAPPSFDMAYDLLSPQGLESKSGFRAEMFRLNGERGLLTLPSVSSAQLKCRVAIPDGDLAEQICEQRIRLETETLQRVHTMQEVEKRSVIERLKAANLSVKARATLAANYQGKEGELRQRLWSDPTLGDWAEKFWMSDREFHLACARSCNLSLIDGMLKWLLDLSRLRNADRATIITRFGRSYDEHERIIAAVEAPCKANSGVKIEQAVREHIESSEQDFQSSREKWSIATE